MTVFPPEQTHERTETEAARGGPSARGVPVGLRLTLALLFLFAAAQGAGVLLRDRIEGRVAAGPAPSPQAEPGATQPRAVPATGARFGPEVREVTVASAPSAGLPEPLPSAPPPVPVEQPAPPQPKPQQEQAQTPARTALPGSTEPALPEETRPEEPPPAVVRGQKRPGVADGAAPAGGPLTHVLQVGVFRSQKYRRLAELRLDKLGVPHYRIEGTSRGASFRLTVPVAEASAGVRAGEVLDAAGYLYRISGSALEARFLIEEEARHAVELLSRTDLRGKLERVEGETPLWTVLAGPYSEPEARAAREFLAQNGLESILRPRP